MLSGVNDVDSGGIFKVEKEFAIFQKLLSYPYICSKYFENDQKSKIKTTNKDILEINKNIDLLKLFKKQPQDLKIKTYESIINSALIFFKYKYEDCLISCFELQLYENLIQDKQVIKILDVFYSSILDSNFLATSSFVVKLMNKLNIDILKPILFSELLSKFKKQIDENIKVNKLISSKSAEPQTTIVTSLVNKNNSLLASAFSSLNNLGLTKSNLLTVDKKITPELQYELDKYPFKLVLNVQKHDNWDRRILVLSLDVKESKMNPSFLILRLSQLFNIPVSPMPLIKKEEITGVERGCHFALPISQDGYLLPENLILLIFSMVKFNVLSKAV